MATMPKTTGTCANKLYTLKQEMAALKKKQDAEMDKLKKEFKALSEHTLGLLNKEKSSGATGDIGKVTKVQKVSPVIEDISALWPWMKKNDAKDLFQARLSSSAVKERWDAGVAIPGIGKYSRFELSITKAK